MSVSGSSARCLHLSQGAGSFPCNPAGVNREKRDELHPDKHVAMNIALAKRCAVEQRKRDAEAASQDAAWCEWRDIPATKTCPDCYGAGEISIEPDGARPVVFGCLFCDCTGRVPTWA